MTSCDGRAEIEGYQRLDAAFRAGDLTALTDELGSIDGFPNIEAHRAMGSCLGYAIGCSPLSLIAGLLELGADPNESNDGYPSLIAAVMSATPTPGAMTRTDVHQLVDLLLDHGADTGQRGFNDDTPLHVAASLGDLTTVDLLLARGADPNAITRIDDTETPLEVAAAAGHERVVNRLRPLTSRLRWETAVRTADTGTVRRILRTGYDIDRRDGYGQTALMRAAHAGHRELVDLLIAEHADLDHTAKYGLSALMLAVVNRHPRVARLLVRAGADTTIEGTGAPGFVGKNAADLAEDAGDHRLAAYIRDTPSSSGRNGDPEEPS